MSEYNKPSTPRPLDLYEFSGIFLPGVLVTVSVAVLLITRLPPSGGFAIFKDLPFTAPVVTALVVGMIAMSFLVGHAIVSFAVIAINNFFLQKCIGRPHVWLLDPLRAEQRTCQTHNILGCTGFLLVNAYIALYVTSAICLNVYKNQELSHWYLSAAHYCMIVALVILFCSAWYRKFIHFQRGQATVSPAQDRVVRSKRRVQATLTILSGRGNQPILASLLYSSADISRAFLEGKRIVKFAPCFYIPLAQGTPHVIRRIIRRETNGMAWDEKYPSKSISRVVKSPLRIKFGALLELVGKLVGSTVLRVQREVLASVGYFQPLPEYVRRVALKKISGSIPDFSEDGGVESPRNNILLLHALDDHAVRIAEDVIARNLPHRADRLIRVYNLFRIARNSAVATAIASLALAKAARVNQPDDVVLPGWVAMLSVVLLVMAVCLLFRALHLYYGVYHKEIFGSLLTLDIKLPVYPGGGR